MAKGTGIYGAYRNVKPINEDFGDMLEDHEQLQFQHREEQRTIQDRKDKKAKDLRDRAINARKSLRTQHTGIRAEDEKRGELTLKAADVLNKAMIRLEENPNDIQASILLSNLEDFPNRFKQMTERYSTWMKDGLDGLENATYSPYLNRDNIDKVEKVIQGQVQYDLDAKGNVTGTYDKDGDGQPDFTWDGMATGVDLTEYKKRFDVQAFKNATKKNFGTLHTLNPDGTYNTIEVKDVSPESKTSIRKSIENLFGESVATITDDGLSYIFDELDTDMDIPVTENMLQQAKNQFYLENLAMFDRTELRTKDYAAQDRDQDRWRKAQEFKQKNKKKSDEQENANFLRTLVDGTISGDPESLGAWRDKIVGEGKDEKGRKINIQVRNVEFTKDNIVFDLSNGESRFFDLRDKERLKGELSSFANYKKSPQESMSIYDLGKVQRKLGSTTSTKPQSLSQIRQEYKDVVGNSMFNGKGVVKFLESKGFVASNGWYLSGSSKNIKVNHKGEEKKFDVSTEEGVKAVIDFVSENSGTTESYSPASPIEKTKDNPLGVRR